MLHNLENIDLFNLFEIALDKNIPRKEAKKKAIQYCEEHKTDKSVIMTFAGAINMQLDYNTLNKGDGTMYSLFEELAKTAKPKELLKSVLTVVFLMILFWKITTK